MIQAYCPQAIARYLKMTAYTRLECVLEPNLSSTLISRADSLVFAPRRRPLGEIPSVPEEGSEEGSGAYFQDAYFTRECDERSFSLWAAIIHFQSRNRRGPPERKAMTIIAGIKSQSGLILAADTEEQISQHMRTSGEKLHFINAPMASWKIVLAGAGHVDYILMARDLIQEKVTAGSGTSQEIVNAIRQSIQEIWRDYASHEGGVDLRLLIGSYCSDSASMFTVVSGAAVRTGRNVEAMGIGDAYLSRVG